MAQPEAPAPAPTPAPAPPAANQLTWARYAWVPAGTGDQFTQAFSSAAKAGQETALTGNGAYVLYRDPAAATATPANQGVVDLRLVNASAYLLPTYNWKPTEAVSVLGGSLQIDFSRSAFQTALDTQGAATGSQSINATGTIAASGTMQGTGGNASITGSVTPDGTEAGYFFQKTLPQGTLRGVTLWGR